MSLISFVAEFQDAAIGGDKFFALVQTMPDHGEAIDLIELAKGHFLALKECNPRGVECDKINNTLRKLNLERRRLNLASERADLKAAVIDIYGHEGWEQVRTHMIAKRAGNIR